MAKSRTITAEVLNALGARAERLGEAVLNATEFSPIPEVRGEAERLAEVLLGWVGELEDMLEHDDPRFDEHAKNFEMRLLMAERKVGGWWKPPRAKVRPVPSVPPPRRSRKITAA